MKKLNMNIEPVPAERVIIKQAGGNIVITNPEVMKTKLMGKEVYQITGNVSSVNEEDIKLVMQKTGKSRETVAGKLEELNNDLARAIMELKGK